MASSGAAAPSTFHEGRLKPYPHEELGTPTDVSFEGKIIKLQRILLSGWTRLFSSSSSARLIFGVISFLGRKWRF